MNCFHLTKIRREQMYIIVFFTAKYMCYKPYIFCSEKNPDVHLLISISNLRHISQQVCSCMVVYMPFLMNVLCKGRGRLMNWVDSKIALVLDCLLFCKTPLILVYMPLGLGCNWAPFSEILQTRVVTFDNGSWPTRLICSCFASNL